MKDLLQFTLLGLATGAFIAGLSLTTIVSYRGAGVVNLSNGAIAMLGAYTFFDLRTAGKVPFLPDAVHFGDSWSAVPAAIAAVAVCALVGALFDVAVLRRLRNSAPIAKLVASLGLLLALQAFMLSRFGPNGQAAPAVLPDDPVTVFGLPIPISQFIFAGIVILLAVALIAVYRWSRFGLATRAAAEDEAMAMRTGLSPARLSMMNSVLAASLAGLLGVLFAPLAQLDTTTLALAIIPALGAALIGQFSSFGLAALAGFGLGVLESVVVWLQTMSWFPTFDGNQLTGISDVLFFLVIVAVLFTRGQVLPARGTVGEKSLPEAPAAKNVLKPLLFFAVVGIVGLIFLSSQWRLAGINSLIGMVMCLSFVVGAGFLGQVSLMQAALAGLTALVLTKLSSSSGIGFPFAPLIGITCSVVFGTLTAVPTLRVRGVSLAIITLAGAVAVSTFWFGNISIGFNPDGVTVAAPTIFGADIGPQAGFDLGAGGTPSAIFGFLCLAVTLACTLLVLRVRRGILGQRMLAIRSDERAAAAAGIRISETKLVGYALSSFLAGLGGALYAYSFGAATAADFDIPIVLGLVAAAYVGGITTVTGALLGGLGTSGALLPFAFDEVFGIAPNVTLAINGVLLIFVVVRHPEGIAGAIASARRRRAGRHPRTRLPFAQSHALSQEERP